MQPNKILLLLSLLMLIAGCGPAERIDNSIQNYRSINNSINLGDHKNKVIPILESAQKGLAQNERKYPESHMKEDTLVEIYYARSARIPDGMATDDEFTPYIFNNGLLVGIGWSSIGGTKTQGQATNDIYIAPQPVTYTPPPIIYTPPGPRYIPPIPTSGGLWRY